MNYGSVCSGIEAATVAWAPLGWKAAWFAEIEKFPSAVLAHHYPDVENRGDFTRIKNDVRPGSIDLLVGGTPCQSFSVAGLRGGLADDRGNLALQFFALAARARPKWVVWENVPGVLSSNGGRDFGTILGALGGLGHGWAYRILDAYDFGTHIPRRRVFVVGCLGNWAAAFAVLFERESLGRNKAICDKAVRVRPSGVLKAHDGVGYDKRATLVMEPEGFRKLTPTEKERIMGFPDGYTMIPWRGKGPEDCPDGPRHKALGNSMAVPVMRWIGERIETVEAVISANGGKGAA